MKKFQNSDPPSSAYRSSKRTSKRASARALLSRDWVIPFCKLAIANTTSNLMVPLAGLIDTAFLGHLEDIRYLNGVALASIIFNIIYWSFNFFRMGTTGPTAQAVGQADNELIWLILVRNSLLALGVGMAVWLLKDPIAALGFSLLQADAETKSAGAAFYDGRILGAPAVLINFVLLGWLLGRSQGKQVVVLAVVSNFSNIFLDYYFIRVLKLGSYGAGLATALSQYLMLAVGLSLIISSGVPMQLWSRIKAQLWQLSALKSLFALNLDILIRTFALVISMSLFTNFSSGMGATVLGVNALLMQVVLMAAHFMDGIALAVESYAGNFYGRQRDSDLRWLLILGSVGSVFLGLAITLALLVWPHPFFSLLTSHRELLSEIPRYAVWLVPVLGLGAIAFTLDGYFLGLTASRVLRNATLIAAFVGFLPMALVASYLRSPHLLWFALSMLMLTRAITLSRKVAPTLSAE